MLLGETVGMETRATGVCRGGRGTTRSLFPVLVPCLLSVMEGLEANE